MSTYRDAYHDAVKEILPDAVLSGHHYTYKEYVICINCGHIRNKTGSVMLRFIDLNGFVKQLNKIKA